VIAEDGINEVRRRLNIINCAFYLYEGSIKKQEWKDIFIYKYGISGGRVKSFKDVAEKFSMSESNAKFIIRKMFRKMGIGFLLDTIDIE